MNPIYDNMESLNFSSDSKVVLRYEGTADCFLMNENEVETALSNTDVVSTYAGLLATPGLQLSSTWHGNILDYLRDDGYLEDYERDGTFEDYLAEIMHDNFYDLELVDSTIQKYDYKRGACTLTAEAFTTVENLLSVKPNLFGWSARIEDGQSVVMLEG